MTVEETQVESAPLAVPKRTQLVDGIYTVLVIVFTSLDVLVDIEIVVKTEVVNTVSVGVGVQAAIETLIWTWYSQE